MALKDRLTEALNSTPAEDARRRETLRAVLDAAGAGGDAEIRAAIVKIIGERERSAASFDAAGQSEQAQSERAEIAVLRGYVGAGVPADPEGGKKPSVAKASGARWRPPVSRQQVVIVAAAVLALAVIAYFLLRPMDEGSAAAPANNPAVTAFKDDRTLGNPKAPATLLEYAAPTCPFCAHFTLTAMPKIKKDYIDTGKVFYIFRVFPLRAVDVAVEGIARCLPPDRYFPYMERMFRNQPQWDPDGYDIPDVHAAIVRLALSEGISPERADQCMTDRAQQDRINQVGQDGEQRYQIDHTPTFVVNGQVVDLPPGQDAGEVLTSRIKAVLGAGP